MSIEQEIRNEIDNIKQLKIDVDDINNHLSVLEGLCRDRNKKVVDDAYQRGLDDAWEAAWKIMDIDDFSAMDAGLDTAFNLPVTEAIEKLKTYEEKQKAVGEIKVGDEVIDINGNKTLVTNIHGELYDGLCYDGLTLSDLFLEDVERIGKHYDIDKILEEMKK